MALDTITLATGPVSFGVDFANVPGNPDWRLVLDLIASSGLRALELGPVGYLPEDKEILREALRVRGLTAAGSFVFEDLHDPTARDAILDVGRRACRAIAAAGGQILIIIDRPGPERIVTAGRSGAAERLSPRFWRAMLDQIDGLADVARQHQLQPVFHPHAGSYVEFADEVEHLLMDSDIDLCLDTGHLEYAGMRAHSAIADYGPRIAHIHLKDTDPRVLTQVDTERIGFWAAIRHGIFCPLRSGAVDLPQVAAALEQIGYSGYATIEQDRVPGTGTPLEDLLQSIAVLHRAGIGAGHRAAAPPAEAR